MCSNNMNKSLSQINYTKTKTRTNNAKDILKNQQHFSNPACLIVILTKTQKNSDLIQAI